MQGSIEQGQSLGSLQRHAIIGASRVSFSEGLQMLELFDKKNALGGDCWADSGEARADVPERR